MRGSVGQRPPSPSFHLVVSLLPFLKHNLSISGDLREGRMSQQLSA